MGHEVLLGWRHGRLWGVDEVSSGLACDCVCPHCQTPLVAKKGKRNRHHFAHHKKIDCLGSAETILHILGKQILSNASFLFTPAYTFPRFTDPWIPPRKVFIKKAWCEKRYEGSRPDLALLLRDNSWLNIELTATNPLSPGRINWFARRRWNVLEIDCSDLLSLTAKKEELFDFLRKRILGEPEYKFWRYLHVAALKRRQLEQVAVRKRVKHRFYPNRHYYTVGPCPQQKRVWRSAFRQNTYYASLTQDCWHCPYFLRQVHGEDPFPEAIFCWGHRPELVLKREVRPF